MDKSGDILRLLFIILWHESTLSRSFSLSRPSFSLHLPLLLSSFPSTSLISLVGECQPPVTGVRAWKDPLCLEQGWLRMKDEDRKSCFTIDINPGYGKRETDHPRKYLCEWRDQSGEWWSDNNAVFWPVQCACWWGVFLCVTDCKVIFCLCYAAVCVGWKSSGSAEIDLTSSIPEKVQSGHFIAHLHTLSLYVGLLYNLAHIEHTVY